MGFFQLTRPRDLLPSLGVQRPSSSSSVSLLSFNFYKKSSSLKLLGQLETNLTTINLRISTKIFKTVIDRENRQRKYDRAKMFRMTRSTYVTFRSNLSDDSLYKLLPLNDDFLPISPFLLHFLLSQSLKDRQKLSIARKISNRSSTNELLWPKSSDDSLQDLLPFNVDF